MARFVLKSESLGSVDRLDGEHVRRSICKDIVAIS